MLKPQLIKYTDKNGVDTYTIRKWSFWLMRFLYLHRFPAINKYGWYMDKPDPVYYAFTSTEKALDAYHNHNKAKKPKKEKVQVISNV